MEVTVLGAKSVVQCWGKEHWVDIGAESGRSLDCERAFRARDRIWCRFSGVLTMG